MENTKENIEKIKKALYKEQVEAVRIKDNDGNNNSIYEAELTLGKVIFVIPFLEQTNGEGKVIQFPERMEAKLLARWISLA